MEITTANDLRKFSVQELRDMFQDFEIENEEFVPMYFRGVKTEYKISKYGNVLGKRGQKLKWTKKDNNRRPEASVSIYPDVEKLFEEQGFVYSSAWRNVTLYVHRLVALHYLPFPEHLPEELKQDWEVISDTGRELIRDCLQVDHLDSNTFNPRWDNLEWVTPKENCRRAVLKKNNS